MSRSGYTEDYDDYDDQFALARWRGTIKRTLNGKRGQAFLKEALIALDAMPVKELTREHLLFDGYSGKFDDPVIVGGDVLVDDRGCVKPVGAVCFLGAVGQHRGVDMSQFNPDAVWDVAAKLNISEAMAREIVWENDDGGYDDETPAQRWQRMRNTIERWIIR